MTSRAGKRGRRAETLACAYLRLHGLRLVTRNYHTRFGEIDLIMTERRAATLVFVEVRYRRSDAFGTPAASVTRRKQERLSRAARSFLGAKREFRRRRCRFDVVSISKPNYLPHIEWIRDAFQP